MIVAKNINKSFGNKQILNNINLELKQGEITVLLGPSGCGKTTLLRNLSLLDLPDSGEIEIFDKKYLFPNKDKNIIYPYPELTVVFQQLFLWPHLTNRENILLAIDKKKGNYVEKILYFNELVADLEMSGYIEKYPNQSSLGQKQRVAIARALILSPKFIFFDEITASLDNAQIRNIMEIMEKLRNRKIGFFIITHNAFLAKKIADRMIFMNNGIISLSETTESAFLLLNEHLDHI